MYLLCKSAYSILSLVYRISVSFCYIVSLMTCFSEHPVSQFEVFLCKVSPHCWSSWSLIEQISQSSVAMSPKKLDVEYYHFDYLFNQGIQFGNI